MKLFVYLLIGIGYLTGYSAALDAFPTKGREIGQIERLTVIVAWPSFVAFEYSYHFHYSMFNETTIKK